MRLRLTRKRLLLLGLVGVWGAIFGLRALFSPPAPHPAPPPAAAAAARRPAPAGGALPRLKLELLDAPQPPVPSQIQNIFGHPQPPPPPPTPAAQAAAAAAAAAAQAAPPPPDPFQEEAKRLKYLGYIEQGQKTSALILQGQDVQMIPVGELFANRFKVKTVEDDALVLTSPDGTKEARLLLAPDAPRPGAPPGLPGRAGFTPPPGAAGGRPAPAGPGGAPPAGLLGPPSGQADAPSTASPAAPSVPRMPRSFPRQ